MKRLKALPIIFYVLQTIPAYAAPANEHFEILDMTNPAVIREMDRIYVMHPDQNSIQQGIRLYALAIEAWNPSYKNTNVRLKIMNHVKDQGVLNGLIAPSILLIEHALKTNDVPFAMSLITMVRHISPIFNSQLERKWKLPETSMNFAKFVTNSDEQISKYYGRLLGSDFQAYADGERKLAETSLRQTFFSQKDDSSDLDSLIKKATSKPASVKTTAQDLIHNVLDKGPSKDTFVQDIHRQCLQFSRNDKRTLLTAQENKTPDNFSEAPGFKSFAKTCLSAETFENNNLGNFDINSLIQKTWATDFDCDDFQQQTKSAKNNLQNKIEQDRSRYSDMNWVCLRDCGMVTLPLTYRATKFGFTVGAIAGGPPGVIVGGAIAATLGTTVSLLACSQMSSCGGTKVQNDKDRKELEAARARAEAEQINLEIAKAKRAEQIEKQKNEANKKNEEIQKKEVELQQTREKALNDLGIKENDIIKGVDFCTNSTCNSTNIVENDNSFNAVQRNLDKEQLKQKRIKDYYAFRNNAIETNPKNTQDLLDTSSVVLRNCLKEEWNKEFGVSWSMPLLTETPEEVLERQKQKLKQHNEQITTENPWDINTALDNGTN